MDALEIFSNALAKVPWFLPLGMNHFARKEHREGSRLCSSYQKEQQDLQIPLSGA